MLRTGMILLSAVAVMTTASCTGASEPALDQLPTSVRAVTVAPVEGRISHAAVWTGSEMIIWGGLTQRGPGAGLEALADGAAYDPQAGTWRTISAAPLAARTGMAVSWTGDTFFVWGGSREYSSASRGYDDGAEYDPITDSWTALPPSPLEGAIGARATWTGAEVLVWGGRRSPSTEEQRTDGAAYNPLTRAWRPIPAAPLPTFYEHGAVWTGTELLVLAGTYDHSDRGPLGAAYDPARDQWRVIADSPLGQGYALDLGWDGTEVLAAYPVPESTDDVADDGATDRTTAAAYDLTTDSWRKLPRPSVQPNWSVPVWTPEAAVYWDATPDPGTAYLIDDETWVALPAVDGPHREFPSLVWTGTEVIAWGGNDNCEAYADGGAADCELKPLNDGFALRLD